MAVPAGIIGISFVDIASTRMANIQTVLDAVMAAETDVLFPILRGLAVLYVGRQFLLCLSGNMGMSRFMSSVLRVLIVITLVTHNGQFVQWIRDPIFNKLPQALSAMITGDFAATTVGQPLAAQFDAIATKGDAVSADIVKKSSNWFSMADWVNVGTAKIANLIFQAVLACIVGIWLLGQTFLAIVMAMGLPLLCFELFERTRHFLDAWVGKIVGFSAFGFATSFVLALEMEGLKTIFDSIHTTVDLNVATAVGMLLHVVGDCLLDLLTIASLPAVVGFGAGGAAALATPSAMVVMRSLSLAGGVVGAAASRAAGGLSSASGGISNVVRRG